LLADLRAKCYCAKKHVPFLRPPRYWEYVCANRGSALSADHAFVAAIVLDLRTVTLHDVDAAGQVWTWGDVGGYHSPLNISPYEMEHANAAVVDDLMGCIISPAKRNDFRRFMHHVFVAPPTGLNVYVERFHEHTVMSAICYKVFRTLIREDDVLIRNCADIPHIPKMMKDYAATHAGAAPRMIIINGDAWDDATSQQLAEYCTIQNVLITIRTPAAASDYRAGADGLDKLLAQYCNTHSDRFATLSSAKPIKRVEFDTIFDDDHGPFFPSFLRWVAEFRL